MKEIWKKVYIDGDLFVDYKISNLGRIKRLKNLYILYLKINQS